MTSSYLNKIGENEFRIDFETSVKHIRSKSVEVDGETYTREWVVMKKFNSKKDFENAEISRYTIPEDFPYTESRGEWRKYVIDEFKPINGQVYFVWNYNGFIQNPANALQSIYGNSTVWYVNILKSLFYGNHIKNVVDLYNDKTNNYINRKELYNSILRNRTIDVSIFNYGYNNCIKISINIYTFLKMRFTEMYGTWMYDQINIISKELPDLIPQKLLHTNLSQIEINNIAINILNKSINYKQLNN